jgi:chemotaxis protein CheZ
MSQQQLNGEQLELARQIVSSLESGDEGGAAQLIVQLAGTRDSILFQEVGRLTRELHDSINSFVADAQFQDMAENQFRDAAERLQFVIETTEKAANTTMDAVEESLPLADKIRGDAEHLAAQWDKFNSRQLTVEDFRSLSAELTKFLHALQDDSQQLSGKLSDVLMAQGFQDITGQVIKKVINLVQDVENKLIELIRLSGGSRQNVEEVKEERVAKEMGPVVPGVEHAESVSNQDDVDELLSSLGF